MSNPFSDVIVANKAFAADFQLGHLSPRAARGLAVLTCIDSRIKPLAMLGLQPGDAKIVRNAGARVTEDTIRSLSIATQQLGVERIIIVTHTDCADPHTDLANDIVALHAHPGIPDDVAIAGFEYNVHSGLLRHICSITENGQVSATLCV